MRRHLFPLITEPDTWASWGFVRPGAAGPLLGAVGARIAAIRRKRAP